MNDHQKTASQTCPCQEVLPSALVIDDSSFILTYMKNLLQEAGCHVICASNGLEGVKRFEEYKPHMVFIDALMPEMDGFSACSIIRNTDAGKKALIYMITTSSEPASVEKAFAVGCDDYFTKPINETIFIPRLKQIIRKYNYGRIPSFPRQPHLEMELSEARALQTSLLPKPIKNPYLTVDTIFSPYAEVSGDFIDYWWKEPEKKLGGYLLDVTGHSVSSAMQVFALRLLYCQASQTTRNLAQILEYMNDELFIANKRSTIATAFVFDLYVTEKKLFYASAGVSPFYLNGPHGKEAVNTAGYPLGFKKGMTYHVEQKSVKGFNEMILATDGFTELIDIRDDIHGKHDDASAILIKLI